MFSLSRQATVPGLRGQPWGEVRGMGRTFATRATTAASPLPGGATESTEAVSWSAAQAVADACERAVADALNDRDSKVEQRIHVLITADTLGIPDLLSYRATVVRYLAKHYPRLRAQVWGRFQTVAVYFDIDQTCPARIGWEPTPNNDKDTYAAL